MGEVPSLTARKRGNRIADLTVARGVPNAVPYGYRRNADASGVKTDTERDAKALVPDEQAAPIVRRIFALRRDGHRLAAIVRLLDEAGVPSPRGGLWTHSTVETIVKNPRYCGLVQLGHRRVEGAHEALVSKRDWQLVQGTRVVTHSGTFRVGLAGGLMQCSGCGRPLSVAGNADRLTYSCRRKSTHGRCPRPVHVSKRGADEFVEQTILDVLDQVEDLDQVASARELEQARGVVERAKAEREAFVKLASALDPDDFRAGYDERRAREAEAADVYDALLAHAADVETLPTNASAWQALDAEARRRVARSLIDAVVVSPSLSRSPLADVSERFAIRWTGGGELASAGR